MSPSTEPNTTGADTPAQSTAEAGDAAGRITVYVNGDPVAVPADGRLAELVDAHTPSRSGVAVAVDGEVVPRPDWATRRLPAGARIEILTAVQGG